MSDDLVAFLRARLDEDEAMARGAASETPWSVSEQNDDGTYDVEPAEAPDGLWHGEVASHIAGYDAKHIARHDPAQVLREVAAKRAILDAYEHDDGMLSSDYYSGLWVALCASAAIYSDHPGYRPEWALQ